jgi:hypothetical protein
MTTRTPIRLACLLLSFHLSLMAAEKATGELFYVNNTTGSDELSGKAEKVSGAHDGPFKTIMQAVRQCSVGARIEIANTGVDYRETVYIENFQKGRPGAPLVINGNGANVSGLMVIPEKQWELLKDDVYYFTHKVGGADYNPKKVPSERRIGDSWYGRMPNNIHLRNGHQGWFTPKEAPNAPQIFLLDGKPGENVVTLEDLPQGGFFYDSLAKTLKEPEGQPVLYFRLPHNRKLADCLIEIPQNTGIFAGDDYVTIENIGSCYSLEDGFDGFWGQNVVFRNIHAFNNTEQGVSFHGNGSSFVDGGLIEHNGGAGVVDVMSSTSIYRNVTVRNNHPDGMNLRGAHHALYDCRIIGNSGTQVNVFSGTSTSGSLVNCLVVGNGPKQWGYGVAMNYGQIDRCTIVNCILGVNVGVGASIKNSIITDCSTILSADKEALTRLTIRHTILGLGEATLGGQKIGSAGWADFIKACKGADGAIIDTPKLKSPFFALPQDSPHLKAGESGTTPGAQSSRFKEWTEQK